MVRPRLEPPEVTTAGPLASCRPSAAPGPARAADPAARLSTIGNCSQVASRIDAWPPAETVAGVGTLRGLMPTPAGCMVDPRRSSSPQRGSGTIATRRCVRPGVDFTRRNIGDRRPRATSRGGGAAGAPRTLFLGARRRQGAGERAIGIGRATPHRGPSPLVSRPQLIGGARRAPSRSDYVHDAESLVKSPLRCLDGLIHEHRRSCVSAPQRAGTWRRRLTQI
jgi:hypothetical protein